MEEASRNGRRQRKMGVENVDAEKAPRSQFDVYFLTLGIKERYDQIPGEIIN